jgi:hypothetical protein
MRTGEWLPCRKVLKILLVHMSGESERVRETPCPNTRRQTDITQAEQTLGSRTLHGIDIGLGIQEAGLNVSLLF